MTTRRITMIMAVVTLTTGVSLMPAQAEDGNAAALKHQLEEVRQQLHELELKVQRMESELGTAQVPSPAAGAPPMPSSAPAPGDVIPPAASQTSPSPVRLEAGASPSPTAVPDAYQWREMLKGQWHSVKTGMSDGEIRKLLGTPSREFTLDGKAVWYYSYPGIGNGSVMFSRDEHTVAGWQHPPFGFW